MGPSRKVRQLAVEASARQVELGRVSTLRATSYEDTWRTGLGHFLFEVDFSPSTAGEDVWWDAGQLEEVS